MNLFENLQLYYEFADKRKDIKQDLRNSSAQRRENLIQIFLWRNTTTIGHWCDELYEACSEITIAKFNKQYPSEKFILQYVWGYWEDDYNNKINKWVKDAEIKENKYNITNKYIKVPKFSKENLYNFIKDYHEWLSKNLSTRGFVELPDIEHEIQELLNKYPIES